MATKPLTNFKKTISRAESLLTLFDAGTGLDEPDDAIRAAVIISVAAFDRYFTTKFCDVLVPHLKSKAKPSKALVKILNEAGLDTEFALELAVARRPFRKIRTIVQNSLSRHTTHRTEVIDKLFLALSLKDLTKNAEKKANRANLRARIGKLVDIRNDIAHEAHIDTRGNPKHIHVADIRSRIQDLELFTNNCDQIIDSKFGASKSVST